MKDLDGSNIKFQTEDNSSHIGMINWKMADGSVSIVYPYKDQSGSCETEEYETTETILRRKIVDGDWILID